MVLPYVRQLQRMCPSSVPHTSRSRVDGCDFSQRARNSNRADDRDQAFKIRLDPAVRFLQCEDLQIEEETGGTACGQRSCDDR